MANYNNNKKSYGNNNGYQAKKSNNNSYSQNNSSKPPVKHSGAKRTKYVPKTGPNAGQEQFLTTGWCLSKGELISVKCVTTVGSKESDKGWFGSVACTMTNTKTGVSSFHWGTMEKSTGKVVIDKVAMVLSPKGGKGGYCGTFVQ